MLEIQVPCLGMALGCCDSNNQILRPDLTEEHCGDLVCVAVPQSTGQFLAWWPASKGKVPCCLLWITQLSSSVAPRRFLVFLPGNGGCWCSDAATEHSIQRVFDSAQLICTPFGGMFQWIADSLAVGVKLADWKDEQVFLFLVVKESAGNLTEEHLNELKNRIKNQLSPRHVPAHIHAVPSIPHTLNGKKSK